MIESNEGKPASAAYEQVEREGFIHKVYGVLSFQLIITSLFCMTACTDAGANFFKTNPALMVLMVILAFATLIPLACCQNVAHKVPLNYLLLLLFTIAEGYLVATACASYSAASILAAVGMTTGIVVALTFYALYTKTDYSTKGGLLCGLLIALILFGLIVSLSELPILNCIYCLCGSVLFSCYIVVDAQLVIGRGANKYSVDSYIMAAMAIYLDVINLLVLILRLIGGKRD